MSYSLLFDLEAGKELKKLPGNTAIRIFRKIQETKENPGHYWVRLEGRSDYKLRIGDFRVIADIDHKSQLIEITKIGHRRNIYERD